MILAIALFVSLASAPPFDAQAIEREARKIDELLIAPCCWTQPVSVHYSAASDEVKSGVRRMLREGKNRQQILDAFVAEYGTRILAEPPARGLHWLPWVFLALGGGVTVIVIRRLRSNREAIAASEPVRAAPADDQYAERLDEELRDLD
ncbi:MAG: cytochrome c-type biogenesis protein CcmH [Acidobacteria bacterium]|nr:cytochrome c-type biogenesis protein CcmH [Acidobacteriota bacterium]